MSSRSKFYSYLAEVMLNNVDVSPKEISTGGALYVLSRYRIPKELRKGMLREMEAEGYIKNPKNGAHKQAILILHRPKPEPAY